MRVTDEKGRIEPPDVIVARLLSDICPDGCKSCLRDARAILTALRSGGWVLVRASELKKEDGK